MISNKTIAFFLLFIYWLIYEHVNLSIGLYQKGEGFVIAYFSIKAFFPFFALRMVGLPKWDNPSANGYTALFIAFLGWAIIPTLTHGDLIEYLKLVPRLVFFVAVISFIQKYSGLHFYKAIIYYVCITLLLYLIGYFLVILAYPFTPILQKVMLTDEYTLLGNFNVIKNINGFPFVQLRGFWNEPSNAAGIIFSAYFLSKLMANQYCEKKWDVISIILLVTGFLTFSMAGQIAFGAAHLVGIVFSLRQGINLTKILRHFFSSALILLIIFARPLAVQFDVKNDVILALSGAQKIVSKGNGHDVTDGRFGLMKSNLETVKEYLFGIGVQNVIGKVRGEVTGSVSPINDISASAPIFWLVLTGIPGLILLVLRELIVVREGWQLSALSDKHLLLFQSYVCVVVQNLSYGTWMTASYFLAVAMVLVHHKKSPT